MNLAAHIIPRPALTRIVRRASVLLLVLLSCAAVGYAIPLSTYRERVQQSVIALDSLQAVDENTDEIGRVDRISQTLAEVRGLLPPTEIVEWEISSHRVDNKWIEIALKNYEELAPSDTRRGPALTEITERLGALAEALAEVEALPSSAEGAAEKDQEKAHLAAILRRAEYSKGPAEKSALTRVIEQFLAWIRSLFPKRRTLAPGSATFVSQIVRIVVVLLALAVIGYAIWKFAPQMWRGRGQRKSRKREARVVLGEHLEPDQSSSDLLAEAEALARAGNLRAAIRKGYIALLCELGDRKIVGLAQHKTNRDYLRALRSRESLYREMQHLTLSFENHWYGFIPASPEDWIVFRSHYEHALKQ